MLFRSVQELPAIEVLARVDVLCADKTGTITEGSLAVAGVEALGDIPVAEIETALAALAHLDPDPNATALALAAHFPSSPAWRMLGRVPFSSARKWSAMSFDGHGNWLVGAPENEMLFCGVALGREDASAPVNSLVSERMPLEQWAMFL